MKMYCYHFRDKVGSILVAMPKIGKIISDSCSTQKTSPRSMFLENLEGGV